MNKITEKTALVIHPILDIYQSNLQYLKPGKKYKDELLIKLIEWSPPIRFKTYENLTFDGETFFDANLYFVMFLPEMRDVNISQAVDKVEHALKYAKEDGCTVAAMAGFNSIVIQGKEEELAEKHGMRITSGNAFTAATVISSIENLAKRCNIDLSTKTISIIGASGDIGSGCFLYFADQARKLILTARGLAPLKDLVNKYGGMFDCEIEVTGDNKYAAKRADIAIIVTSSPVPLFEQSDFASGAIVCDASAPANVKVNGSLREDIFLYHGGIAQLPFDLELGMYIGLPGTNAMFGCQVEGLLNTVHPDLPLSYGRGNISTMRINKFKKFFKKYECLKIVYSIGDKLYSESELDAAVRR
ncbi:MAG: hypothetical protein GF398_21450 [Chitinivibrionales bacterium]|nr:hypothetical protein [Chitinivibrionales bacterium]